MASTRITCLNTRTARTRRSRHPPSEEGLAIEFDVLEWVHLILRWAHVFAGILWIGSTYYFTWLDGRLEAALADAKEGTHPQVWMVHSGGFYVVEKQKVPAMLPGKLHWFRYEALITWVTGLTLFILVYYHGGLLGTEEVSGLSNSQGIAVSVGILVGAWILYDTLWISPLGKNEWLGIGICAVAVVALCLWLPHVFSGRAAYLQLGATFGTLMTANVWMRILPAQRQLVAATKAGVPPDLRLAARAKGRSKHNTFMVVPVVFTMISNHFPISTYGNEHAGIILAVLVFLGWGAAKIIRSH